MKLANQLEKLGTENAFAVSKAAHEWEEKGHKVYPFHLGDFNLPTPHNIVEAAQRAIADGKTSYCPGAGIKELRAALADDVTSTWGVPYFPDNVSIQPGGKPVIGKFLAAIMNPGDEILYPVPGFPIYESQIDYQGGVAVPYTFIAIEDGSFKIDLAGLEASITPKTKAIIFNNYQNPTSASSTPEEIQTIADMAIRHDLLVLSDDAYFELQYSGEPFSIATLHGMRDRTVILYTFSKRFAMTGWRIGAAIGPKPIIDVFNKLNTNEESCTAHFIQWAAVEALQGSKEGPALLKEALRMRRDATVAGINNIEGLNVVAPNSTMYLYIDASNIMQRKGFADINQLMEGALLHTGVSFCTRKHFGRLLPGENSNFIRIAYSGIEIEDIQLGLQKLKEYFES